MIVNKKLHYDPTEMKLCFEFADTWIMLLILMILHFSVASWGGGGERGRGGGGYTKVDASIAEPEYFYSQLLS